MLDPRYGVLQNFIATPLPSQPFPQDLLKAWKLELDQPNISDVQFHFNDFNDKILYARSSILVERSEYFRCMFQQDKWSESKFTTNSSTTKALITSQFQSKSCSSTISTKRSWNNLFDLYSTMYRRIKTIKSPTSTSARTSTTTLVTSSFGTTCTIIYGVEFYPNSLYKRPIDLFIIADKIFNNRVKGSVLNQKILKDLKPDGAVEMLFNTEWFWPDLKEMIMNML
ncbi:unnamed protein product [Rhizophagus irregularis]|nr:unnamed protein product [Rhizophagus irregularis]